jgi:hypothetical protein
MDAPLKETAEHSSTFNWICLMQEKETEKRKFRRYNYKPDCCPILDCRSIQYKVLNISEGGLKIEIQRKPGLQSDSTYLFIGNLCLANGEQIPVSGKQVWIIGNEIGIKLNAPINENILDSESEYFQDAD